ncbi:MULTISPECIES: hypothetical protein [Cupriavidus]|uniref:hypothetical protein n=1 Tax=Cupriavidus TaxID=106589 RepID=UPI001243C27C|nr:MULTISPECIES: hypothetical protein [Cupriavidus]KAB0594535.1 hypothetical protein F7R19_29320 [Cupriavidus pauculus]UAL03921.1 hypothetical protein K8O84_29250 [Cupriavidus pauculus]
MHINLLRNGNRALILPRNKDLIDCPLLVRHWLGTPYSESVTEITIDTPLPGISPPEVLAELLQKGFCALDVYGVVRSFEAPPPLEIAAKIARDADASATNLLCGGKALAETRAVKSKRGLLRTSPSSGSTSVVTKRLVFREARG